MPTDQQKGGESSPQPSDRNNPAHTLASRNGKQCICVVSASHTIHDTLLWHHGDGRTMQRLQQSDHLILEKTRQTNSELQTLVCPEQALGSATWATHMSAKAAFSLARNTIDCVLLVSHEPSHELQPWRDSWLHPLCASTRCLISGSVDLPVALPFHFLSSCSWSFDLLPVHLW